MRRFAVLVLAVLLAAPAPAAAQRISANTAALQVALRAVGTYSGTVDGIAGPATRRATRIFQARNGLVADGIAGPMTRRALGRRGRPGWGSRALRASHQGWDVVVLQFLLARRGFPSGSFDGGLGARTDAALRRFQAWSGLTPDGVVGPATFAALRRPPPISPIRMRTPVGYRSTDSFGPRGNRFHSGMDFPAPTGTTVVAAAPGCVVSAGWDRGGYGYTVVLRHSGATTTWYAHLSRIDVDAGGCVPAGVRIGAVGSTGFSSGPHLHWEVRLRGAILDPRTALTR